MFPHLLLPLNVLVILSALVNWQTKFWIWDSPICSLQYSLKLVIHAVWQTKTCWLSSNSLQTDSPASGCHAKTEQSGTEIETVIRGIPILSLFFLQFFLAFQFSSKENAGSFLLPRAAVDLPQQRCGLIKWQTASGTRNHHSSLPDYFTIFNQTNQT